MSLYIQTNVSSLFAQNSLSRTQNQLSTSFARLSSGFRINSAADDAAGLGIATSMNSTVHSLAVAERNSNDGISMAQTADGAAGQIADLLTRMRELAVQGSNGTLGTADQQNLQTEFQQDQAEIDRIAASTTFNGINLLNSTAANGVVSPGAITIQVGTGTAASDHVTVSFGGGDTTSLGVPSSAVQLWTAGNTTTQNVASAQSAITSIDTAISTLSTIRANFGAAMNRFSYAVSNLQAMQTNTSASLGRIRDVDVAQETSMLSKSQVLSQAGAAVLSQANQTSQLALKLLGQ